MNDKRESDGCGEAPKEVRVIIGQEWIDWIKAEFPSSRGGRKLFTFGAECLLPTDESCRYAVAVDRTILHGLDLTRATTILFAKGVSSLSELCSYQLAFTSDTGSTLDVLSEGITTRIGRKAKTAFTNCKAGDDEWRLDSAVNKISPILEALRASQSEVITLPHPLLRSDISEIRVRE